MIDFDITNRWSGAVQFTAKIGCDESAATSLKLGLAVNWAFKNGANLSDADLRGADLRGAYLRGAYLSGAEGASPELITPLIMLLDQPGAIRAYKLVTADGVGPFNGGITYVLGGSYEVANANADPAENCAAGINVASLDWCLKEWVPGYRILVVEFEAKDIACIPTATDGKFRLHRCRVVAEKQLDYKAMGLVPEKVAA